MTRTGRIVAALGSIVVGVIAAVLVSLLLRPFVTPGTSLIPMLAIMLFPAAAFGAATAAAYTWTVNGPFVFARNRARFMQRNRRSTS